MKKILIISSFLCMWSHDLKSCDMILKEEFSLKRGFISTETCLLLCEAANEVIEKFYVEDNVRKHITNVANTHGNPPHDGRDAYLFAVHHSSGESDKRLPGINFNDLPEIIQEVTKKFEVVLGIEKGRYLLSFQRYYANSAALPLHYDGELYDFAVEGDKAVLKEAMIPQNTAVLTLINSAVGGGTMISNPQNAFKDGVFSFGAMKKESESIVVEYDPGDLLIFNNSRVLHGVESLNARENFTPPYIRYTMSLRPLEYNCQYFNIECGLRNVTYSEAVEKNIDFMQNKWPLLYKKITGTEVNIQGNECSVIKKAE